MDELYNFIYRAVLTEAALDKEGRQRRRHFGEEDRAKLRGALSFDMLDADCLADAREMGTVYAAIHAFENMVRQLVQKAMGEEHGEKWWEHVPEQVRKRAKSRMEEDAKFRYHGSRGTTELMFVDFSDLSSIIINNWLVFEDVLTDREWVKAVLKALGMSRNVVMHGGKLAREDVERIGMNIRDWIRQSG